MQLSGWNAKMVPSTRSCIVIRLMKLGNKQCEKCNIFPPKHDDGLLSQ